MCDSRPHGVTVASLAPLSLEFSRQEYWSGLPFLSPGDFLDPGIEPGSPALQADSLPSEPPGKPIQSHRRSGTVGISTQVYLSPIEGNGDPLQYSCLENPMDRAAWQATVHGVASVGHNLATKPPPPCLPPKPVLFRGTETQKMALVWVSKPD